MNLENVAAITGIALAAYGMRCSGVWLVRRSNHPSRLLPILEELPGIVLTAAVAPAFLSAGAAGLAALTLTALLAAMGASLSVSTVSGFLFFLLLRSLL